MEKHSIEQGIDKDKAYKKDPNLGAYLYHLVWLIAEWKRDHQREVLRTNGPSNQVVPTKGGKQVHYDTEGGKSQAATSNTIDGAVQCEGCGRRGHLSSHCIYKTHSDFNHTGLWKGCKAFEDLQDFYLRIKKRKVDFQFLHKTKRENGSDEQPAAVPTPQPTPQRSNTNPTTQPAPGGRGYGGR